MKNKSKSCYLISPILQISGFYPFKCMSLCLLSRHNLKEETYETNFGQASKLFIIFVSSKFLRWITLFGTESKVLIVNRHRRNSGAATRRRSVPHWDTHVLLLLAGLLKAKNRLHILFKRTSVSSKVCLLPLRRQNISDQSFVEQVTTGWQRTCLTLFYLWIWKKRFVLDYFTLFCQPLLAQRFHFFFSLVYFFFILSRTLVVSL